jgi:hypothetical protein
MLLGEYLQAEAVTYDDCRAFQIVCPSCKEPVFKAVREAIPESIHYLSHYNKDKAYDTDCELRVESLSKEEIEKSNSGSRQQRLEYFLRVLQAAILDTFYPDMTERGKAEAFATRVRRSKGLKEYREYLLSHARKVYLKLPDEQIMEFLDGYIDDITEISGEFPPTAFSLMIQKRIARDIFLHLLSPKARENYMFLLSHAYISLIVRLQLAKKERGYFDYELYLHEAMMELPGVHTKEGDKILRGLARWPIGPPHAIEGSNLLRKMSAEIEHEMFGILLHLPYFEMIEKANELHSSTNDGIQSA